MFNIGKPMKSRREYQDLCDPAKPLELRTIERTVFRNFDSICVLLNKLELKTHRQPNVIATLPKLAQLLRDIWMGSQSDSMDLNFFSYWRNVLRTLADQSWQLMNLVRENHKEIEKMSTNAGQLYFQLSFHLFCIQLELEAIFPGGKYTGYKISSSQEAADWWQRQFGLTDTVTWHDFQFSLSKRFTIRSLAEANELKRDVNITGSDHVSSFEFDTFVRLFAPWGDQIVDLWRLITKDHPAFVRLRFKEVKSRLKGQPFFSYLFRRSTNTPAVWSIGYMNETGSVTQILVKPDKTIVEALTECAERGLLLFPAGKDRCHAPDLSAFQQVLTESKEGEKREQDKGAAARLPPEEVYVVAPKLQCSHCLKRSDEVSTMDLCSHILCDACFEKYVQPILYENWSWQASKEGLRSLCPVCSGSGAPRGMVAGNRPIAMDIDLISLDDSDVESAPTPPPHQNSWLNHPLADFDPMSFAAKEEAAAAAAVGATEVDPAAKRDSSYAFPDKIARPDHRPPVHPKQQTNPFVQDEYSLLQNATTATPKTTVLPAEAQRGAAYRFYGSMEEIERVLAQFPGLRFELIPESAKPTSDGGGAEGTYSQIWNSG